MEDKQYNPTLLVPPSYNLIGHRGVKDLAPENTIAGFKLAKKLGLNWIELDTRLTKDGVWVVMHDETLERTTNGAGLVIDTSYKQLKNLRLANGEKIPTLSEVLQLASDIEIMLNIEVKIEPDNTHSAEYFARKFVEFIQPYINNFTSRHLISCFNLDFLIELRKQIKEIPIGYLVEEINTDTVKAILDNNFTSINAWKDKTTKSAIDLAKKYHIPVFIFTVNNKDEFEKLIEFGVNGIFTDRPDLLNLAVQQKLQELAT